MEGSPELRVAVGPSVCAMEISLDQVRIQGTLLLLTATVQGKNLRMLVDSGATHCIGRSGLLSHPDGVALKGLRDVEGKEKATQSCVFDVPLRVAGRECTWDFDGILGQTWLSQANPVIDWSLRTISWSHSWSLRARHRARRQCKQVTEPNECDKPVPPASLGALRDVEIQYVDLDQFRRNLQAGQYAEVVHLNVVKSSGVTAPDTDIAKLIQEFSDYLREELPDGCPPERDIKHASTVAKNLVRQLALNITKTRREIIEFAQKNLRAARDRQATYYNQAWQAIEICSR
ncbi:TPA: hypothetical protein N0F65_002555 [Lagenidium giganteum]|uniref:Peptidase A2 domain-containing protein n=1 Tax=Lagenidium giganteum TaxID=4803 RepID=A0AAV2YJG1_9STRA|nr:TPA: hypothetical protein N0F65_002555 [Lagenidium giganteum]